RVVRWTYRTRFRSPPVLTAEDGADALAHAVEAFTAAVQPADSHLARRRVFVGKNPLTDQLALYAAGLVARHLTRAVTAPDPAAREGMMLAALAAGLAFGTAGTAADRKSTRLNSSHVKNSYAVFCLKKKRHERSAGCGTR